MTDTPLIKAAETERLHAIAEDSRRRDVSWNRARKWTLASSVFFGLAGLLAAIVFALLTTGRWTALERLLADVGMPEGLFLFVLGFVVVMAFACQFVQSLKFTRMERRS